MSKSSSVSRPLSPSGPPAIWAAFAQQGRWKNWVMLGQLVALAFMVLVCFAMARTTPDVVVVDETGEGRYIEHAASSEALIRFLDEERRRPSDLTLESFSKRFVSLTSGINSATVDEAWSEALALMAVPLAQKVDDEAKAQKLLETYRIAQVRTTLTFDEVKLIERRGDKAHIQVVITRRKGQLFGTGMPGVDRQTVDIIVGEVPRSRRRPDGLQILEWRTAAAESVAGAQSGDVSEKGTGANR